MHCGHNLFFFFFASELRYASERIARMICIMDRVLSFLRLGKRGCFQSLARLRGKLGHIISSSFLDLDLTRDLLPYSFGFARTSYRLRADQRLESRSMSASILSATLQATDAVHVLRYRWCNSSSATDGMTAGFAGLSAVLACP